MIGNVMKGHGVLNFPYVKFYCMISEYEYAKLQSGKCEETAQA